MDIKLYSFNEALERLKKNEISMLIRAKHMKADFQNKCILLYSTERYISLGSSCISGKPDILWQTILDNEGNRESKLAYIESDDILAEDYIDTSQWTLCDTREKYDNVRKKK
jgi:hypothetical protein